MHVLDSKVRILINFTILGIFGRLGTIYYSLKSRDIEHFQLEMGMVDDIDKKIQELISAIEQ